MKYLAIQNSLDSWGPKRLNSLSLVTKQEPVCVFLTGLCRSVPCLLYCSKKSPPPCRVYVWEEYITVLSYNMCFLAFVKHLRILLLIFLELGFLLSLSNDCFTCHLVSLWVICCSLPLAQMKIESKLEHGIGVSHLCLLPAHQCAPSSY